MSVDPTHATANANPAPDRSAELDRVEATLELEERRVFAEVKLRNGAVRQIAAALEGFAAQVHSSVAELGETPALSGLEARCRAVVVPHIDFDGHAERVLTVRADALRARRWVMESLQADLARVAREIGSLQTLLSESADDLELAVKGGGSPAPVTDAATDADTDATPDTTTDAASIEAGVDDIERRPRDRRTRTSPEANGRRNTSEYRFADRFSGAEPSSLEANASTDEHAHNDVDAPVRDETESLLELAAANEQDVGDANESERAAPRSSPRVRMEAQITCSSDSNFFTGLSSNISDGGVFVATSQMLEPGTAVDLSFHLPSGIAIEGQGVVKWLRPNAFGDEPAGVGIGFHDLDEGAAEAISFFLAERDPIFYIS